MQLETFHARYIAVLALTEACRAAVEHVAAVKTLNNRFRGTDLLHLMPQRAAKTKGLHDRLSSMQYAEAEGFQTQLASLFQQSDSHQLICIEHALLLTDPYIQDSPNDNSAERSLSAHLCTCCCTYSE